MMIKLLWCCVHLCIDNNGVSFELLTPEDPEQRGAQISIKFSVNCEEMHKEIEKRGVVVSIDSFHN